MMLSFHFQCIYFLVEIERKILISLFDVRCYKNPTVNIRFSFSFRK